MVDMTRIIIIFQDEVRAHIKDIGRTYMNMSNNRVKNLFGEISKAELNLVVGIRIAHLTGDSNFSFYGAELQAGAKVAAHYHNSGIEIYQIIEGEGQMYTGMIDSEGRVAWNTPFAVKVGDCFTVDEREAHQLLNIGDKKLVVVFGSSNSHITTDRFSISGDMQI